jgi:hypothetical protein
LQHDAPPRACTASVTVRQAGDLFGGVDAGLAPPKAEWPSMTIVASAMIRPALARWA